MVGIVKIRSREKQVLEGWRKGYKKWKTLKFVYCLQVVEVLKCFKNAQGIDCKSCKKQPIRICNLAMNTTWFLWHFLALELGKKILIERN